MEKSYFENIDCRQGKTRMRKRIPLIPVRMRSMTMVLIGVFTILTNIVTPVGLLIKNK